MAPRRTSLILPCRRLDDFPTHLSGPAAADLLAAWTALWHPALLAATGRLPGWHPADDPPVPNDLDGELILIPSVGRERLPGDWCDRVRATAPQNPPPVDSSTSRDATIAACLTAASIDPQSVADEITRDFLALGYAHLQIELLTHSMRYATVLDADQFTRAVVEAAGAAVNGNDSQAREELARAFDLLSDARNHVYAVDYYLVDVTLLADSTLGEPLRRKLELGTPTNLLVTGQLIDDLAANHPPTLAELRRAIEAGTACVVGGPLCKEPVGGLPPEAILSQLMRSQEIARRHLGREIEVFGQFQSQLSPLLPEILTGFGFRGALHVSFDGGKLPRADQRKTRWGAATGAQVDTLAATPLDVSLPETWLNLAKHVGDSIAHDHVATIVLAGWPGHACEYFDDLRRALAYTPVLGRLITLDAYFNETREVADWSSFEPKEYSLASSQGGANPISTPADRQRRAVRETFDDLSTGLLAVSPIGEGKRKNPGGALSTVLNPWNFSSPKFVGYDPLNPANTPQQPALYVPDVPGCGYGLVEGNQSTSPIALAEGRTLRNEFLEVVVSESAGGIQSLRTHGDRSTRASQRLIFHDGGASVRPPTDDDGQPRLETQMLADRIEVTRNDAVGGEITSHGRLVDSAGETLARYIQAVRISRGLPVVVVDVSLDTLRQPTGDVWKSYFASRLAWTDEAATLRRGIEWTGRNANRSQIEAPDWVEITDAVGEVTCFGLGLPCHRRVGATWLDTLLVVPGEERRRFQFALGLDCAYPSQTALALATAGQTSATTFRDRPPAPSGWFLHVGVKNVVITHIEKLVGDRAGVRLRLLETEGRDVRTTLSAFRPFHSAQLTDFLGQPSTLLSVVDGNVRLDIGPHRWLQIEAEWEPERVSNTSQQSSRIGTAP